jgi:integrase
MLASLFNNETAMNDNDRNAPTKPPRLPPWNKDRLIGPKPPLKVSHIWSIRTMLKTGSRIRDLALFNLAIDSKLRGCDLVALRVDDVAPHGRAADRSTVRQTKTGRTVRFEMTEQTREAVDAYLHTAGRAAGQCLFPGRRGPGEHLTTRQHAHLVGEWVASIGLPALGCP